MKKIRASLREWAEKVYTVKTDVIRDHPSHFIPERLRFDIQYYWCDEDEMLEAYVLTDTLSTFLLLCAEAS